MKRLKAIPALLIVLTTLMVACARDSGPPTSDVVSTIPWPASESLSYKLTEKSGALVGHETLGIATSGDATQVSQSFVGEPNTDKSIVTVDSKTMKPQSALREIVTSSDTTKIEVTYSDQGVVIKQNERQSGLTVPLHSYDNDSSLFLWRTLTFEVGHKVSYNSVITNRRNSQKVTVTVFDKEPVSVPAGQFTAWRLEISAGTVHQQAWYADTPSRPLVKYDNGAGLVFELETAP